MSRTSKTLLHEYPSNPAPTWQRIQMKDLKVVKNQGTGQESRGNFPILSTTKNPGGMAGF